MSIIYITGRGGDSNTGLGSWIKEQCSNRIGLPINNQFLALGYQDQAPTVKTLSVLIIITALISTAGSLFGHSSYMPSIGLLITAGAFFWSLDIFVKK